MNCILLHSGEAGADGIAVLEGRRAIHICEVLRVGAGSVLRVGVVNGPLGSCEVESASISCVRLRCRFDDSLPEPPRIDVVLAMPRPKILKRLWPQLSAIGVGRIFIVNASKVEGNYFATHWLEPEFYRPLLLEGLEQCVHTFVPEVGVRRRLKPFLEDEAGTLFRDYLRIAGDPHGAPVSGIKSGGHRAVIAVGPEGGWSEYEAAMLGGCGFAMMSAGSRILRSDTACIALIAAVQSVMDRGL